MKKLLLAAALAAICIPAVGAVEPTMTPLNFYLSKTLGEDGKPCDFQLMHDGDTFLVDNMEEFEDLGEGYYRASCAAYVKLENLTTETMNASNSPYFTCTMVEDNLVPRTPTDEESNDEDHPVDWDYWNFLPCWGGNCHGFGDSFTINNMSAMAPGASSYVSTAEHMQFEFNGELGEKGELDCNATVKVRTSYEGEWLLDPDAENSETVEYDGAVTFYVKFQKQFVAVAGIEADQAPAEYFNLQGVRVAQPEQGQLYIKRQGGKAVKVIR